VEAQTPAAEHEQTAHEPVAVAHAIYNATVKELQAMHDPKLQREVLRHLDEMLRGGDADRAQITSAVALTPDERRALEQNGRRRLESIGVDSWGVDYALIGEGGNLLENPYHYRDSRTTGVMEAVFERVSRERIYAITGIQFLPINTIYQLYVALAGLFSPDRPVRLANDRFDQFQFGIKRHAVGTRSRMAVDRASGRITAFAAGVGNWIALLVATERTATSGCNALTVWNDPRGIVGISSDCTDSAVTICAEVTALMRE